jgi:peptidoglycan/LPS O-acetylase OafA/YrhL
MAGLLRGRYFIVWSLTAAFILYLVVLYRKHSLFALVDIGLLRCIAGFCVGAAISKVPESSLLKLSTKARDTLIGLLIVSSAIFLWLPGGLVDALLVPAFALLILLLQADQGVVARLLTCRGLTELGRTSYSIYMVHWFLIVLAAAVLKVVFKSATYSGEHLTMIRTNPIWGDLLLALVLALVIAIASFTYRTIEAPWRSFGRGVSFRWRKTEMPVRL